MYVQDNLCAEDNLLARLNKMTFEDIRGSVLKYFACTYKPKCVICFNTTIYY